MSIASSVSTAAVGAIRPVPPHIVFGRGLLSSPLGNTTSDALTLQRIATKMRLERGATVFTEGDTAEFAYKVVSGCIRLCRHLADGRRQIARFLFSGDFFGLEDLSEHNFTAEAVSDVVLAAYRQKQMRQVSDENSVVQSYLLKQLSQGFTEMQRHLVVLGRHTAMERVASFLLLLSERTGSEDDDLVEIAMCRRDMADYLGLTIETVSRTVTKLKNDRLIQLNGSDQIRLLDSDRLQALADGDE